MTKSLRLTAAMTTTVAVAALLAGCGGDKGGDAGGHAGHTAATSEATAAPAATRSAKDVVLTAAELPAGVSAISVPEAQLQQALDQITKSADTLKAVPAECGSKTAIVDATAQLDVSKFGMVAGTAKSSLVTESVLIARPDIAKLRSAFTGACRTMTADVTSQGVAVSSKISRTVLDVPKGKASDLLVVEEDSTSNAAGQQVVQKSYQGYAQVGGYAVTVSVKALSGAPDRALFDTVLAAAVDKAAKG